MTYSRSKVGVHSIGNYGKHRRAFREILKISRGILENMKGHFGNYKNRGVFREYWKNAVCLIRETPPLFFCRQNQSTESDGDGDGDGVSAIAPAVPPSRSFFA